MSEKLTPRSYKHAGPNRHDHGILNHTESTSNPITLESDENLSTDDTNDLEIGDGVGPLLVTDLECLPAFGPDATGRGEPGRMNFLSTRAENDLGSDP